MNELEFEKILSSLADDPARDVEISGCDVTARIGETLLQARLLRREGSLYVKEGANEEISAFQWLTRRAARLPVLAQRVLENVPQEETFVKPSGKLLHESVSLPADKIGEDDVDDALEAIHRVLDDPAFGLSRLLYLSSGAGEGKTTLINELSRIQAARYLNNESEWFMVPIRLGGRPFMRLGHIVVAELSSRMQFRMYYDTFLEMMKLNVIVPAFDGFEDVLIEGVLGEGVSVLGKLVGRLQGKGRLLVAAKKAWFEVNSFSSQAGFFDSLEPGSAVELSGFSLNRWSEQEFFEYARLREYPDPPALYNHVKRRFPDSHPLLTCAVLVRRLVEIAKDCELSDLDNMLGSEPEDYFYEFVNAIIEREARDKWIDKEKVAEVTNPLISVRQHHKLLSMIAREMWINGTEILRRDFVGAIVEMFAEDEGLNPLAARQIQENLISHSLLVASGESQSQFSFDHQDFYWFFLGEALASELLSDMEVKLESILRVGTLSKRTADSAVKALERRRAPMINVVSKILDIGKNALYASFVRENVGVLMTACIHQGAFEEQLLITSLVFPLDSLKELCVKNIQFKDCHFRSTALTSSTLVNIKFESCIFDRIEIEQGQIASQNSLMEKCEVSCIYDASNEISYYDPTSIRSKLESCGMRFDVGSLSSGLVEAGQEPAQKDRDTEIAERALRAFMRSTQINENLFRKKLGGSFSNKFFDSVLPTLIEEEVVKEVPYVGQGQQKRYKLNVPMKNAEVAIRKGTTFDKFVSLLKTGDMAS